MKKLIALLLSIIMILSLAVVFTACGENEDDDDEKSSKKSKKSEATEVVEDEDKEKKDKKEDEDDEDEEVSIVGKWQYDFSFKTILELAGADFEDDEMAKELLEECDLDKLSLPMIMEFDKKTVKMYIDEDQTTKCIDKFADEMIKAMVKMIIKEAKENGETWTEDDVYENLEMTKEELKESLLEEMNVEDLLEAFEEQEGKYKLEDGKLYVYEDELDEDEYIEISLTSKKLTVEKVLESAFEDYKDLLPIEFKKVK